MRQHTQRLVGAIGARLFLSLGLWAGLGCWLVCAVAPMAWATEPVLIERGIQIETIAGHIDVLPQSSAACWRYVQERIKRKATKSPVAYPTTVKEAVAWIQKAQRENRFFSQRGQVMGRLQLTIDRQRQGNLHLLFGNNHTVLAHYRFFNELLHPGRDKIKLDGLTHLALEAYLTHPVPQRLSRQDKVWLRSVWGPRRRSLRLLQNRKARRKLARLMLLDQQPLLDLYTRRHRKWAYRMLEVLHSFLLGRSYPKRFRAEVLASIKHARRYRRLRVLATDISLQIRSRHRRFPCWLYPLREIYSLKAVRRHLRPKRRNVIAYMWGADHIRKGHLPRFIPRHERVVSVRLMGGGRRDVWDQALAKLHLKHGVFLLETPGAEDGDMMIHFPGSGRGLYANAEISAVALAKIVRRPGSKKPTMGRGPRSSGVGNVSSWMPTYRTSINAALTLFRPLMAQCRRRGKRHIDLQLQINVYGRVTSVKADQALRHKHVGWSLACLQRILSRLPLPPPPSQGEIEIAFRLQGQANPGKGGGLPRPGLFLP